MRVLGRTYRISAQVFNPKLYGTSRFMARHLRLRPEDVVLDLGTGSGIQAIVAAQTAAKVIAVDINPEAVRCARENVRANGLEAKISVLEGDLFSCLDRGQRFDIILFTPPYLEGTPRTPLDHALFDPGKALLRRFFAEAKDHLVLGGYVQMVYSSIADTPRALAIARELGWTPALLAQTRAFGETLLIYKLAPK
jgi:release factor glutamine methyltransferase